MRDSVVERLRMERARSRELTQQSERLSQELVDTLRGFDGPAFGESGDTFALRLARVRPIVGFLRHDLRRWLEHRGLACDEVQEITLACSEACANAVEHPLSAARRAFEVNAAHHDGEVVIVVRDSGHWRSGPSSETRGPGMQMIRALMTEVEVVHGSEGTEIVMRRRFAEETGAEERHGVAESGDGAYPRG